MRKALENDVEEDNEVRNRQTRQRNIVDQHQSAPRYRKALVEDHERELDGPERRHVERRAGMIICMMRLKFAADTDDMSPSPSLHI
jgi:hypothetical protein